MARYSKLFRLYAVCLLAGGLLTGCPADRVEERLQLEPFFDLEGYVDREIDRLSRTAVQYTKTLEVNGKTETKEFNDLDLSKELAMLRKSDINRPAWLDRYAVDSIRSVAGQLDRVEYTAQQDELRTRLLRITYQPSGQVAAIEVQNRSETLLSNGQTTMAYDPASHFVITTLQETWDDASTQARIDLRWQTR